jgi:hypothetical protein
VAAIGSDLLAPRVAAAAALAASVNGRVEVDEAGAAPLLVLSLPLAGPR